MPGKSHGPRSLVGYNPWGLKESDTTERLLCVCVCVFSREPLLTLSKGMLQAKYQFFLVTEIGEKSELEVAKTAGHGGSTLHVGGGVGT